MRLSTGTSTLLAALCLGRTLARESYPVSFTLDVDVGEDERMLRGSMENDIQQNAAVPSTGGIRSYLPRFLQSPTDIVFGALVDVFVPALATQIENAVAPTLDPIGLGHSATEDLGPVELSMNATFCNDTSATASLLWQLGQMTGLSSLDITRLELVPGSQEIDIGLAALFGAASANWKGTWEIDAKFGQNFNAETTTTLKTNMCNFTFEDMLSGTSTVTSPTAYMKIKLKGETTNIYDFQASSSLTEANIKEMTVGFDKVQTSLGMFGGMAKVNADEAATNSIQTGLDGGSLVPIIQSKVQQSINNNLPYTLGGNTAVQKVPPT